MINDMNPEDIFKMVAVLPKKGVKVIAHLEDEEGEKITVNQICKALTEYVTTNLKDDEDNIINTQLFPLSSDLICNIVPRFAGVEVAAFLMSTTMFRQALITLCLSSILFNQYITQNKLKIVSTSIDISAEEIESFKQHSFEADRKIAEFLAGDQDDIDDEDI